MRNVEGRLKGLMGVFALLAEEHAKLRALLARLVGNADLDARAQFYPRIRSDLLTHELGELRAVYPVLEQYAETREIADAHASQAGRLQAAIAEVDYLALSEPEWERALTRLAARVDEHIELEERDYFIRAQGALGARGSEDLRVAYEAAKRSLRRAG